jgi:hypothetical protein
MMNINSNMGSLKIWPIITGTGAQTIFNLSIIQEQEEMMFPLNKR